MDFEDEIKRISMNIRCIRKTKKITIQELAYKCDIERSNLSRIEAGRSNLTIKTICIICNSLGVELSDVLIGNRGES